MFFTILVLRRWVEWGGGELQKFGGNSATSPMVEWGVGNLPLVSNFWELSFLLKRAITKSGVFQEGAGGAGGEEREDTMRGI